MVNRVDSTVQEVQWDPQNTESICTKLMPFAKKEVGAEPIIVRGAVRWKGLDVWNLTWLANQNTEVDVSNIDLRLYAAFSSSILLDGNNSE